MVPYLHFISISFRRISKLKLNTSTVFRNNAVSEPALSHLMEITLFRGLHIAGTPSSWKLFSQPHHALPAIIFTEVWYQRKKSKLLTASTK